MSNPMDRFRDDGYTWLRTRNRKGSTPPPTDYGTFPCAPFSPPFPDMEYMIQHTISRRSLPAGWKQIQEPQKLYRVYHPEDLWDHGALRKAILREIQANGHVTIRTNRFTEAESGASGQSRTPVSAERTLTHILHCWNSNVYTKYEKNTFTRQQSAGPQFLIHILQNRYQKEGLALEDLWGEDERVAALLAQACRATHCFHLFLARFHKKAYGRFHDEISRLNNTTQVLGRVEVERTECWLEAAVHFTGEDVKILPRVWEEDLLEEWYFEDQMADERVVDGEQAVEAWQRTALIIVPRVHVDDFFGYEAWNMVSVWGKDAQQQQQEQMDEDTTRDGNPSEDEELGGEYEREEEEEAEEAEEAEEDIFAVGEEAYKELLLAAEKLQDGDFAMQAGDIGDVLQESQKAEEVQVTGATDVVIPRLQTHGEGRRWKSLTAGAQLDGIDGVENWSDYEPD